MAALPTRRCHLRRTTSQNVRAKATRRPNNLCLTDHKRVVSLKCLYLQTSEETQSSDVPPADEDAPTLEVVENHRDYERVG